MRVIAGDSRGRRIVAPRGLETRPPTARVRASIFSRIASRREIAGARVLDLFAGSGSLGLEALSRGAATAVFVDSSRDAIAAIRRNLDLLGIAGSAEALAMPYERALDRLGERRDRFDLAFIDPPFALDCGGAVLAKLVRLELLNAEAIVMIRQFYRASAPESSGMECMNEARLGDHRIGLYRRAAEAAEKRDARAHGE